MSTTLPIPFELSGRIVAFGPGIEDSEGYAEPGMRARLITIRIEHSDVYVVTFDFSEFADHNRPYEQANYYDKNGVACLNARQAGYYSDQEDYHLPEPAGWQPNIFTVIEDAARLALIEDYTRETHALAEKPSYTVWLEDRLIAREGS